MTSVSHAARLAIPADGASEVAAVLRLLVRRPWLVGGRDDAAIATVRRHQEAVRNVCSRLGWTLIVERQLVRLVKSPPPRLADWARQAPDPLTCAWFFLLAAAAEGLPSQVRLGQLVEGAKAAAAEAAVPGSSPHAERRARFGALRELVRRGVVDETDGQIEAYLDDDDPAVLLTIHHTRLLHLAANYDPGTDPGLEPEAWLATVTRESDAGRRMRRRLVDDTCVHSVDLDEAEVDWLSRRLRGDDGGPLADAFGLVIERRSEGAAFVLPDDAFRWPRELGDVPFPGTGIVPHVALLVADLVAAEGEALGGPGPGWRGLGREGILVELTRIAEHRTTGKGGWPAEKAADPEGLLGEAGRLLTAVGLLRVVDEIWWVSPVTGRWEAPPNAALAVPALQPPPEAPPAIDSLFDEELP